MGCDIHAYLEYEEQNTYWRCLCKNAGVRDYRMFSIMAGVRSDEFKLFDPRGLPDGKVSFDVEDGYYLLVAPDDRPDLADNDGWTSKANADRWVASGLSEPFERDGKIYRITDPDAHSASWLTTTEFSQCVEKYKQAYPSWNVHSEWVGILAAMKAITDNGVRSRLVFWFDN